MSYISTNNFLKCTAIGATATVGLCHLTQSRDPLVEKINQIAKGVAFASALGLWYLGTRPPIPDQSSLPAAPSASLASSSIAPSIPTLFSNTPVTSNLIAPTLAMPSQVAARRSTDDYHCLRGVPEKTKMRIINCAQPILAILPEEKWGKIIYHLLNAPDEERDDIVDCLLPILDAMPVTKIGKLFKTLAEIPHQERKHCVTCALSIKDRLKNGSELRQILNDLSKISHEKRESAIQSTLHFFGDRIKCSIELGFCFQNLAEIPEEQREKIIRSALLFSDNCDTIELAWICATLAKIPEERREQIITHTLLLVDRLTKNRRPRDILDALAKIPDEENVTKHALCFIDRLDNGEAVWKMLEILNAIPDEERQLAVDHAILFPPALKNKDLTTVLEKWIKTPSKKRENFVRQMLDSYDKDLELVNANHQEALHHLQLRIEMYKYFTLTENWPSLLQVALPVSVRHVIQYLTSKGAIPENRCIVCDDMEMFRQKFDENKEKFGKPFCFVVYYMQPEGRTHARHWTNIIVQNNTVICTDSWYRNLETREGLRLYNDQQKIIQKALPPGFHLAPHTADSPTRQSDHSSCWVFAVRDAVELLQMKTIQPLMNSTNEVSALPLPLLKSMQSLSFFKKNASLLQQVVTSRKKGIPQPQTLGELLSRHTKKSGEKEQNSYIDDRREKYMNLVAEKIRRELPQTRLSLEQFTSDDITDVVSNYIKEKNIRGLQILLPAVGQKLSIQMLLEGIFLVIS